MVIGDPFKFSIQVDPVKEWCDYGELYKGAQTAISLK